MAKLTHLEFVERLKNKNPNLTVVGTYTLSKNRIKVKCSIDGHEWNPVAGYITSCPVCSRRSQTKSHADFVAQVNALNPNISVLGVYVNSSTRIRTRCNVCNHEWDPGAKDLTDGYGCKKCSDKSRTRTHAEFMQLLETINTNVEVLGEYTNSNIGLRFKCIIDGNEWTSNPGDILRGHGCSVCSAKSRTKTHEEFISDLSKVNTSIVPLNKYTYVDDKMKFVCLVCSHTWKTTPTLVLHSRTGCPQCARRGFDVSKQSVLYVVKFLNYYGFGKSNNLEYRISQHNTTFKKHDIAYELIKTYEGEGQYISDMEEHLKRTLPIYNTGIEGFKTEAVLEGDGILLFREIEKYTIDNPIKT